MTAQQEADTASTQLPADAGTVDAADPTTTMAPPETNHPAIHTTTSSSSSSTRLSKTTACLPIVYGSVAHYLGKKADEFQTHEWTLYLRGPNQDDLSLVVSKVVFQLHASFAQPIRELPQPPFEVTERGWGEFEAQIKIHWKDVTEKPTVVNHMIRLYPPGTVPNVLPAPDAKHEPVVAETYDEVVFTDPNESFYRQLTRISVAPKVESQQEEAFKDQHYDDQEDFVALIGAQKVLQDELQKVKEQFRIVSEELDSVDQTLLTTARRQQQQQQVTTSSKRRSGTSASSRSRARPSSSSQTKKAKTS